MSTSTTAQPTEHSHCPPQNLLRDYLVGLTDEFVSSTIDQHLGNCVRCNQVLESIEAHESSSGISAMEKEIVAEAIQFAKRPGIESSMVDAVSNPAFVAPTNIGPYRLIQVVGRGGMGRVYKAEHTKLKKMVAVKLLPLHSADPHAIERFEREVLATGKLNHPSIVTATDAGVDIGVQYLAMEFIDGWDLGRLSQRIASISVADICEIGRQIALGLAHAHSLGMVHRDIKPSNIMLDRAGHVKLLDFGLVLLEPWGYGTNELTTVGQFLGTLDYMAPEQAERSASVDHRSDLYSLGATLFKLLTGQFPLAMFPNQSPIEKLRVLSNHSPVSIRTLRSDLPNDLVAIIDGLLATNPSQRLPSAAHVAEGLAKWSAESKLQELAAKAATAIPLLPSAVESQNLASNTSPRNRDPLVVPQSSRRNHWPWWILPIAGLLPFLVYLGIRILIESEQGNLVIESETDDVRIQLIANQGKTKKQFSVQKGNVLMQIPAGEYEVRIEAPSDTIAIEPSMIALKRGETVLARIHEAPKKLSHNESLSNAESMENPEGTAIPESTASTASKGQSETRVWYQMGEVSVPKSFFEAKYQGRTARQLYETLQVERDHSTWTKALNDLESMVDPETKTKLKPQILKLAETNQLINFDRVWSLRNWLTTPELDAIVANSFQGFGEEKLAISTRLLLTHANSQSEANPNWFELKQTWQALEDRLRSSKGLLLLKQVRSYRYENPNGNTKLMDHLRTHYLWTAFACLEDPMEFITTPESSMQFPWKNKRLLFEQMDLEKGLFLISALPPTYHLFPKPKTPNSEEKQFWQSVQLKMKSALGDWATSGELLGAFGKSTLYFPDSSNGISVLRTSRKMFGGMGGGMGGMGGGMGGMGGMGRAGGSSNVEAFPELPIAVGILAACERLPIDIRPTEELSLLAEMLHKKIAGDVSQVESIFDSDWSRLFWSTGGELQYVGKDGRSKSFSALEQSSVSAIVLHRWVQALKSCDFESPASIAQTFIRQLGEEADPSIPKSSKEFLVKRGREKQWNAGIDHKFPKPHQNVEFEFQSSIYQGDTAKLAGNMRRFQATSPRFDSGVAPTANYPVPIALTFELSEEGWRINKMAELVTTKDDIVDEAIFFSAE